MLTNLACVEQNFIHVANKSFLNLPQKHLEDVKNLKNLSAKQSIDFYYVVMQHF